MEEKSQVLADRCLRPAQHGTRDRRNATTEPESDRRRIGRPALLHQHLPLRARPLCSSWSGIEVAPDTFVLEGVSDKGHPHFYCSAAEFVSLLAGFELVSLEDRVHRRPDSYHWQFVAERLAD